jgi:tetratricopeptide (TPR) repeat protein
LNEILEKNTAYSAAFSSSTLFYEMLYGTDDTVYCPGILAQFLAKNVFDPEVALHIILRIAKQSRIRRMQIRFERISISSMRYSILEKVLPEDSFLSNAIRFYAELRTVGGLGKFPLFWLQYAIAYINSKQFDIAFRYLHTAYEMARHTNFNVYQIDNQYARLLFLADDSIHYSPYERFKKAKSIIMKQLFDTPDRYVYRAAGALVSFQHYFDKFSYKELSEVLQFINIIEKRQIDLSNDLQNEIYWDMNRIAEAKKTAISLLGSRDTDFVS